MTNWATVCEAGENSCVGRHDRRPTILSFVCRLVVLRIQVSCQRTSWQVKRVLVGFDFRSLYKPPKCV